jgi:hypothetical protein
MHCPTKPLPLVLMAKPVENFKTDSRGIIRASAAKRVAIWRHTGRTLLTEAQHQQNNANQNKDTGLKKLPLKTQE